MDGENMLLLDNNNENGKLCYMAIHQLQYL